MSTTFAERIVDLDRFTIANGGLADGFAKRLGVDIAEEVIGLSVIHQRLASGGAETVDHRVTIKAFGSSPEGGLNS